MRIAVDVCIGKRGTAILEDAGYVVVVTAQEAERDDNWFMRAVEAGAQAVVAVDRDLEVLCHDGNVPFVSVKSKLSGADKARSAIAKLQHLEWITAGKPGGFYGFAPWLEAKVASQKQAAEPVDPFPYLWRVRTRLPDRFGTRCRVTARGAMNSARVEFEDGFEVITSRNYIRKAPQP